MDIEYIQNEFANLSTAAKDDEEAGPKQQSTPNYQGSILRNKHLMNVKEGITPVKTPVQPIPMPSLCLKNNSKVTNMKVVMIDGEAVIYEFVDGYWKKSDDACEEKEIAKVLEDKIQSEYTNVMHDSSMDFDNSSDLLDVAQMGQNQPNTQFNNNQIKEEKKRKRTPGYRSSRLPRLGSSGRRQQRKRPDSPATQLFKNKGLTDDDSSNEIVQYQASPLRGPCKSLVRKLIFSYDSDDDAVKKVDK